MHAIPSFRACVLSLFSLVLLSGCVSAPKRVTLSADEFERVKNVQVLAMRRSEPDLVILNNPAHSFGLIGAVVAETNRVPKRDKLRDHLRLAGFDQAEHLRQALENAFTARGVALHWPDEIMAPEKEKGVKRDAWGMRKAYAPATEGVDAILDVNFGFTGYASAGVGDGAPYRPTVVLNVRLLDAKGERVLMSDLFVYNNVFGQSSGVSIEPDDVHVYPDFDDLDAAGPALAEGLGSAVGRVVESLNQQL